MNLFLTCRDIVIGNENSEDEENQEQNGYELLPTSAEELAEDEEDTIEFGYSSWDGESFQTTTSSNYRSIVQQISLEGRDETKDQSDSIPLNTDQIEEIKSIMSKISIPSTAIPEWADSVTDEELKKAVDKQITKKT